MASYGGVRGTVSKALEGRCMIRELVLLFCGLSFLAGCTALGEGTEELGESFALLSPSNVKKGKLAVDVYYPDRACNGTTLFADVHDRQNPRIVEVDMEGKVVWEYVIPQHLRQHTQPGLDVETPANGNVLFVLPGNGVYEIDRDGEIVWPYLDAKISHDADRLPNGNTLYVYGDNDRVDDAHAKEVDPSGNLVWSWSAGEDFNVEPYRAIDRQGWTHANAVTRLANGNTLVNLRNFDLTVEVNPEGDVVWSFYWKTLFDLIPARGTYDPHEPEILPDDRLLVCLQWDTPYQVVEIDRESGQLLWAYHRDGLRTARDGDRLPNGNTLIVGVLQGKEESVIFEVTPEGEIVWQLKLADVPAWRKPGWFYKAQRICRGE